VHAVTAATLHKNEVFRLDKGSGGVNSREFHNDERIRYKRNKSAGAHEEKEIKKPLMVLRYLQQQNKVGGTEKTLNILNRLGKLKKSKGRSKVAQEYRRRSGQGAQVNKGKSSLK